MSLKDDAIQLGKKISTSKIHALGPMGLEELPTTKFVVLDDGKVGE
jgi:gamma-glutamyl phosphate reductase